MNSLGTDFDLLLIRGSALALVAAGLWVVLVVVGVAAEAGSRGRVRLAARVGCPAVLRLWLLGVFVALFAGFAPAQASDTGAGPGSTLDGLPLPDRVASGPTRPHVDAGGLLVRPGDSLWRIARDLLGRGATDARTAALVATLYAVNRHTIGDDPDRLTPGQRLTRPTEEP